MIEIGNIYRFTYKNGENRHINNIVYGLIVKMEGPFVFVIPLNGFLGNQYHFYNVMDRIQRFIYSDDPNLDKPGKIISYETSNYINEKFLPFSHMIIEYILGNKTKIL